MTSLVSSSTRATWPNTPPESSTAWPTKMPSRAPLSTSTRARNASMSRSMTLPMTNRAAMPLVLSRRARRRWVSDSSASKRCNLKLRETQLGLEAQLVGAQVLSRGDALPEPVPACEGRGDHDFHRVGDHGQPAADLAQMVVALVEDDETRARAANTARSGAAGPRFDPRHRRYERRPRSGASPVACITPVRRCPVRVPR